MAMRRAAWLAVTAGSLLLSGCTAGLFSGVPRVDRSRPVVRIETRGGAEVGATTELGILFLGRTATEGPARVHYWLGPDPVVADGVIRHAGGVFYRVEVDFAQQWVPLWSDPLAPGEELLALVPGDDDVERIDVRISDDAIVGGQVLESDIVELPPGTGVFKRDDEGELHFVGLVSARATWEDAEGRQRDYLVFAGPTQVEALLTIPQPSHPLTRVRYLPDGSWVREPIPLEPPTGGAIEQPPIGN